MFPFLPQQWLAAISTSLAVVALMVVVVATHVFGRLVVERGFSLTSLTALTPLRDHAFVRKLSAPFFAFMTASIALISQTCRSRTLHGRSEGVYVGTETIFNLSRL
jgi:uncharacterized membrane protein YoaK (UPF0700 family)